MRIKKEEASLTKVLQYFGDNYNPPAGEKITRVEVVALDQTRDKVVFNIYLTEIEK